MHRLAWLSASVAILFAAGAACTSSAPNRLVRVYDAGTEGGPDADASDAPDANPDLGQPCTDDSQCDEHIPCEYFTCKQAIHRCLFTPDDTQCQDGIYCDGQEQCVLHHGCAPGPVVSCDDGNPCTIDHCDETTQSCIRVPRDTDQDGDPDDHCVPKHDCNDMDPTVSSLHAEVCANHKDDNCNGLIDEMPCVVVQGDTCADAVGIAGPGDYPLSTVGANLNFATSCSVSVAAGSRNVAATVTVPPGPNVDLNLWATTSGVEVALAVDGTCGQSSTELACASAPGASQMHARARNVSPGTYAVVVTTQAEATIDLAVDFLTPSPKPTNETCASALPLAFDAPLAVSIIDPGTQLVSACMHQTGELTYALTLAQAADVRVFPSVLKGSGNPIVGLRDPGCANPSDEITCHAGTSPPVYAQNLPPGTYVITVAGTSPIDVSLLAKTYPPTIPPADESCTTPPPIAINADTPVDLTNNEYAIKDGCLSGGVNGAFDLPLAVPSDVLLVGRFAQGGDIGAVSLDDTTCSPMGLLACSADGTPARVGKRNVPAGDYRAVLTDQNPGPDTLTALVRPTLPPTAVTGQLTCSNAPVIPPTGGFFTGDTSTSLPSVEEGCDAPNQPPGGAPDQTLSLTLTQPQRVVLDMEGSAYETLLDLYNGPACPGTEVPTTCYVGFDAQRSFLDVELGAGQYWIVVDGYSGAKGKWNLDVRVLPP